MEDGDIFDDPTRPSLADYAKDGHAFAIPWSHQPITILQGLNSANMKHQEGPWMTESPFDRIDIALSTILYDLNGHLSSYRDAFSTASSSKKEHLSVSGGLTIGCPFLNASVSAAYDKCVINNDNSVQASRQSSCRMGRVILLDSLRLCTAARELLENRGGRQVFHEKYGDYYIWGFELGADASVCMTGMTTSEETSMSLSVTVAVKALFWEASYTHNEDWHESKDSSLFECAGFNTLKNTSTHLKRGNPTDGELQQLQGLVQSYLKTSSLLEHELLQTVKSLGIKKDQKLALSACPDICRAGVVVQLMLAPFARLEEYVRLNPR